MTTDDSEKNKEEREQPERLRQENALKKRDRLEQDGKQREWENERGVDVAGSIRRRSGLEQFRCGGHR